MKRILVITVLAVVAIGGALAITTSSAGGAGHTAASPASGHIPGDLEGMDRSPIVQAAIAQRVADERQQWLNAQAVIQAAERARAEADAAARARPAPTPQVHGGPSHNGGAGVNWDAIARCETQGNWSMVGRTFSGGLGFYNGTWDSFGGREFADNAGHATREQQIIVAERVYARYGLSGWGCRAYG